VRFPGGLPQNLTRASTDEQAGVTFDVFRNTGNADKRDQRIVRVSADRVEYSARNFGSRSSKKNATRKYAVALYRSDSNSATVVPTDSLFSMTQCLEGMDDVEPDEVRLQGAAACMPHVQHFHASTPISSIGLRCVSFWV
jgi:hypothetical protein